MGFEELITEIFKEKRSVLCVGLDLSNKVIPPSYSKEDYLKGLIESTSEDAVAYKANLSCYVGEENGFYLLKKARELARENGCIFILDSKPSDVGHTAREYAKSYLEKINADAVTVNPFPFMDDTIISFKPYLEKGKTIFILLYTTSPHSQMFLENTYVGKLPLWKFIALKTAGDWSQRYVGAHYSSIGVVASPRDEQTAREIREICDTQVILAPGFGPQGVPISILKYMTKKVLFPGILANVGRSIIAKWKERLEKDPLNVAKREAKKWKEKFDGVI